MFTPLSPLSTRILTLSGFPPQLKTRDIQAVFSAWEDDNGGFKIKWVDDTNAMVIFNDPSTAKRAYLATLMSPPPLLMTSQGVSAKVRPYDGDDATSIIASVQHRTRSRSVATGVGQTLTSGAHNDNSQVPSTIEERIETPSTSASSSSGPNTTSPLRTGHRVSISNATSDMTTGAAPGHHRRRSSAIAPANLPPKPVAAAMFDAAQGGPSPAKHLANAAAAERAAQAELAQLKVRAVEEAVKEEIEELEEAGKRESEGDESNTRKDEEGGGEASEEGQISSATTSAGSPAAATAAASA